MSPTQTPADRQRNLDRANQIRLARSELRYRIARGEVSAAEVIVTCPPEAEGWAIADLLRAQWRWGTTRARRFLWHNGVAELKELGKLTDRQRRLLASGLQRERGR